MSAGLDRVRRHLPANWATDLSRVCRGAVRFSQSLANVRRGAERAGRSLDDFKVYALVNLLLLEPGETLDSERVIREIGSGIMVNVHYLVERWKETGEDLPDYV